MTYSIPANLLLRKSIDFIKVLRKIDLQIKATQTGSYFFRKAIQI